MRDITLSRMEEIIQETFKNYVEPFAETVMTGEVLSIVMDVFRGGTNSSDWLAELKFRNSDAVSVCHYKVYLDDFMRFCRRCKLYLVTEDVTKVISLYFMLHPLYQAIWMTDSDVGDYESMMMAASNKTIKFIRDYMELSELGKIVLDILKFYMMVFTNRGTGNYRLEYRKAVQRYTDLMLSTKREPFITARRYKAQTFLVQEDGFIVLEYKEVY